MPRPIGARILLMTDGLVERRGEDMTVAMDQLARDFGGTMSLGAEQIADQLMEQWGGGEDDVALIVVDIVDPERKASE